MRRSYLLSVIACACPGSGRCAFHDKRIHLILFARSESFATVDRQNVGMRKWKTGRAQRRNNFQTSLESHRLADKMDKTTTI